jgi:hypothetical protein
MVEQMSSGATLIGVDPDPEALAIGQSLGGRIQFRHGEGENLPIADEIASHVICRVAINYMNRAQSLCAGLLLQLVGFQGSRESFWGHSVPYSSRASLFRCLRRLGGRLVWHEAEGYYLGLGTIWWAILEKA